MLEEERREAQVEEQWESKTEMDAKKMRVDILSAQKRVLQLEDQAYAAEVERDEAEEALKGSRQEIEMLCETTMREHEAMSLEQAISLEYQTIFVADTCILHEEMAALQEELIEVEAERAALREKFEKEGEQFALLMRLIQEGEEELMMVGDSRMRLERLHLEVVSTCIGSRAVLQEATEDIARTV